VTPVMPGSQRREVPWLRAAVLCYRVVLRQIVSPGRVAALSTLGAAMVVTGLSIGLSYDDDSWAQTPEEVGVGLADGFGLVIIIPVVALMFAVAALADVRNDSTLVYLWLKPMDRSSTAVAAAAAASTVALPLTVVPTAVGAVLAAPGTDRAADLVLGVVTASALGTVAYSCVFVLAGLLFKRAVLWGIAYVLIWEGLAASVGDFAALVSLRGYTRSILAGSVDFDAGSVSASPGIALVVLVAVSVVALALSTVRLSRLDVP